MFEDMSDDSCRIERLELENVPLRVYDALAEREYEYDIAVDWLTVKLVGGGMCVRGEYCKNRQFINCQRCWRTASGAPGHRQESE